MFHKTGSIFPNPGSGQVVKVYRDDTNELILTASTDSNGQYVVNYHNDTIDLYSEIKVSDTQMGRSGLFRVSGSTASTPTPPPFSPLDIPQITLSLTDNYVSSLWTDDTGNNNYLTQSVGALVPDVGSMAGFTAPDFIAPNLDQLQTDTNSSFSTIIGTSNFEIWVVFDISFVNSDQVPYFEKAAIVNDSGGWTSLGISSTEIQFGYSDSAANDRIATDTVGLLGTGIHVARAYIASSGEVTLRVDDRTAVTGTTISGFRTYTTEEFRVGANYSGGNCIEGTCHVWAFDGNLSTDDANDFYAYLATEYGVTVP
jgi:hypothetical protein